MLFCFLPDCWSWDVSSPLTRKLLSTPLTPLVRSLSLWDSVTAPCSPGSPVGRRQVMGLLSLQSHVSQFCMIHFFTYVCRYTASVWRTLTNTDDLYLTDHKPLSDSSVSFSLFSFEVGMMLSAPTLTAKRSVCIHAARTY